MKLALTVSAGALLVASSVAQNQVPLPAQSATYNGYSRGWSTTATAAFSIVQVDVPIDNMQAGDQMSFAIFVNGTEVAYQTGLTGIHTLATPVAVLPGDDLIVIGHWGDNPSTQFGAHNSYAAGGGTYQVAIEGVQHTLFRAGYQGNIGDPNYATLWPNGLFSGNSGYMGRVEIYTAPLTGYATVSPVGQGCYDRPRGFYEHWDLGQLQLGTLANTSWQLIPAGSANYTLIEVTPAFAYDAASAAAAGTDLVAGAYDTSSSASWDDASVNIPVTFGSFPYPNEAGNVCSTLNVNSNGRFWFDLHTLTDFAHNGGNSGYVTSNYLGTTGLNTGLLCANYQDLDPTVASSPNGHIWYESAFNGADMRFTWDGVFNWQDTAAGAPLAIQNDFQVTFSASGIITIAYGPNVGNGGSSGNEAIVGFTPGGNEAGGTLIDWEASSGYVGGDGSVPLTLDIDNRPVQGTTVNFSIGNVNPAPSLVLLVYGVNPIPGGIDLGVIGAPGCSAYQSLDLIDAGLAAASPHTMPWTVPTSAGLTGQHLFVQAGLINPAVTASNPANTFGLLTSNALDLLIDIN
ncbi:MAG TPA: hypothetical protein ENI87_04490 [bacterium]|nr:hypothetical protein [bacterium]